MSTPPIDESEVLYSALDALAGGDGIDERLLAHLRPAARRALAQIPGSGLLIVDAQMRLRLVEGPAYESVGWNTDSLDGRLLSQVLPAKVWEKLAPRYEMALAGGEAAYEFGSLVGSSLHWAQTVPLRDAGGAVVGAVTVSTDVTDRQTAHAEARRRAFFEGTPLPSALLDADGRIMRLNRALADLLGYDEDDLVGRSVAGLADPADAESTELALRTALAGRGTPMQGDGRYVRRDGRVVHAQHNLTVIRNDAHPSEFILQLVDETQRRSTLDALHQRLGEQAVITLLGERALAGLPLDDLIAEAVTAASQILEADMCAYAEVSPDRSTVKLRRAVGWPEGVEVEGNEYPIPDALRQAIGEVVMLDDTVESAYAEGLRKRGIAGGAAVLVGDPSDPLGILAAFVRERRTFTDAERNFLRAVAHVLAGAITRTRADERARHESLHDSLTGLPNRALLLDRLAQRLSTLAGTPGRLTVVALDIDSFKHVNDALGHAAGDDLLREIAPRLSEVLEPTDTVARLAGDEFAILCFDAAGERAADRIAEQVRGAFVRPFVLAGEPHFLSASLGVVVADSDSVRGADDLLRDADAALHRAKERGRGAYELFDPTTRAQVVNRLQLEGDLRRAIEGDQLRVEYQPYFRLDDGSPAGIEALVRWQHPERGLISPGEFIPVAEESGLIVQLGEWVLRRACTDLADWRDEHDWATGIRITVNVSAKQVDQRELTATVDSALRDTGLPAGLLGIEITEGLLLDESRAPQEALAALKRLGVRLLLDDFGTGYSSLSYLSRFPVDVLKVDRSFVSDLGGRTDSTPIVTAIVALAKGLRLDVIAEGVETEDQLNRLRELGCDYAQGFLLARPMPAQQLVERLSN
jgi:diguanylate cyclase (GGDEF)-like protein/PAS domain S-box-containing protein